MNRTLLIIALTCAIVVGVSVGTIILVVQGQRIPNPEIVNNGNNSIPQQ